jgi:hypothetical protein
VTKMKRFLIAVAMFGAGAAMAVQPGPIQPDGDTKRRANDALTVQEWSNLMELKRYDLSTNCIVPTNTLTVPTTLSVAEINSATGTPAGLKSALQTIRQFQLDQKQVDQDLKDFLSAQKQVDRDVRDVIRDVKTLAREFWTRVLGRPKQPGD